MTYPKLWPVGGHPEGEAKVRQLNKLGPKWLRASGPGWVAEKQNKLSNVKYGAGAPFYVYGWGRARNPDFEAQDFLWRWGIDPLYDGFWGERTRWADAATLSFQAGSHSPGVYLGGGRACDVRSTAPLDSFGNNLQFTAETKLSEVVDYLLDAGGNRARRRGGYETPHATNVSQHRVGRPRGIGLDVPNFTPAQVVPLLGKKSLVVGFAKHGAVSEDLAGAPEMLSPSFVIVKENDMSGPAGVTSPAPIPLSSMTDAAVGREWLDMRAVAIGPNMVCVVMQSKRREPFTLLKTIDARHQVIVACTVDGGESWSNYSVTDLIEPLDAYIPRAIGIDYEPSEAHGNVPESHPAYGYVIYDKIGEDVSFYLDGFCALPPVQDEFGGLVYQALLLSRSKVFKLGSASATQIGTATTAKRMFPFGIVSGVRVVGYTFEGLGGDTGTNWIVRRHVSLDGGVTWEPSIILDEVAGLPDDLDPQEVYWLGPMTTVGPNLLISTMVVASDTPGFYYRFLSVFSEDGGDTWQFASSVTPDTPEWISAAGPAQYAGADRAYMFHRAAAYDNQVQNNGLYMWLGAQFGKIHYCGRPGRWAPYDAAIPDLLKEVP